jgi:flagellar protein FlbD
MIEVTKLGGARIVVNADHIESVETQPDTALVLDNGKRIVVLEDVAEIVRRVIEYQRSIRSGAGPRVSAETAADTAAAINFGAAKGAAKAG